MDKQTCKDLKGVYQDGKCTSKIGVFTDSVSEQLEERRQTIRDAKNMKERFEGYATRLTGGFSRREIIPVPLITLIALVAFTIVLYAPLLGPITALVTAATITALLSVWRKPTQGDFELNIIIYIFFIIIWLGTGIVSLVSVGFGQILFVGLVVDILNIIPAALSRWTKIPYLNYVAAAIAFTITYLSIGGLEGLIVSAIAGLLAILVPIPSFIRVPPYFLPVTTIALLLIRLLAGYISDLLGAIF